MSELDNPTATDIVATVSGSQPEPAATTTESASVPTEAPNGEAPAEPAAAPEAQPAWFVKETAKLRRQRAESERRADRLASEIEALKRAPSQTAQPKSTELRSQDFPSYDAFIEAKIAAGVREGIGAVEQSRSQIEANKAVSARIETFMAKASEQAEAAEIDMDAVMETLREAPLISNTVIQRLAESEQSARLAEYLAENPSELDRVSRLGPALAKKALDKVEAGLAAPPKSSATNAPPPPPKVGGRSVNQTDWRKSENMDDYASNWQREREARLKD